jgi:hypothetical protein
MSVDAPVVWLAEETPEAALALSQWASARGVRIAAPAAALPSRTYAEAEVTQVEQALARAREAVAQLDADGAERLLARAEARLRAHPELPQAPWLMAEVQRGWAARFARVEPHDDGRAKRALAAADSLDGGRAAGVGEPDSTKPILVDVVLDATVDPDVSYLLDAHAVSPGKIRAAPGEHHLMAVARGQVRFADWITVVEGSRVKLEVEGRAPCSTDDLSSATARGSSVEGAGVRCATWVAAFPAPHGVRAGLCRGTSCEPPSFFAVRAARWPPLDEPPRSKGIPAWLTWSIVGVTTAATVIGILAATGIFAPADRRIIFQQGGVRPE